LCCGEKYEDMIIAVKLTNKPVVKLKPEKKFRPEGHFQAVISQLLKGAQSRYFELF